MIPGIVHQSTPFLMMLAGAAARSIALAAIAAAALAVFRAKSVRVKLFVWKGVLVAALAMPALMLMSPAIRVPVPDFPARSTAATAPATTRAAETTSVPAAFDAQDAIAAPGSGAVPRKFARPLAQSQQLSAPAPVPVPAMTQTDVTVAPLFAFALREIPWVTVILAAYLIFALALLARVLVGVYFSGRLVRSATSIDEPCALQSLSAAASAAGLRSIPRVAESAALTVPVMVGVLRPTILLTLGWEAWETDELAAVLAHEASHIARRDALAQRLALVHRAIFWFSPLGWWLDRHLADLAEQASDEAALSAGMDRTRYAEALLGFFAELEAGPERVWWQGVSMAKTGQAEKRVDRILAWRGAMSNRLTKSLVIFLVAVAAPIVLLTAAVHPATYDVQPPPPPAAPQAPAAPQGAAPTPAPAPPPSPQQAPAAAPNAAASAEAQTAAPAPPANVDSPDEQELTFRVVVPRIRAIAIPATPAIPALGMPAIPAINIPAIPPMTFAWSGNMSYYKGFQGGYYVGRYNDWGPRFVIIGKDSNAVTWMSGDREDAEHARSLRSKIPGEFIWFEQDDKAYIISDQATVDRAKKLWEPQEALSKEQENLGKQQEALGQQQEEAAQKMEEMKLKIPDMTADMQKLETEMKQLSASGGTVQEIGDLQRELGELQQRIGEVESSAGREQGMFGRSQGELGRKQGELGRRQGELGRQQAQLARDASRQMKQLLDDAVAKGVAKPE
jgi:beta-lactamase regulating signal transducer with metallopeptidase domain